MGTFTSRIGLYEPATGETNWNDANEWQQNFTELDNRLPKVEASGTFTATGDANPAADFTVSAVSTDETLQIQGVIVTPDTAGQVAVDYEYNYEWRQFWDDTNGELDVTITVNWDTQPGAANDITMEYSILTLNL